MPRHLPKLSRKDIEKRLRSLSVDENTIGDLLLWRIDNIEIHPKELEQLLKKRGINTGFLPTKIRGKVAARKAIANVRKDLEEGNLRVLMRKVRDNAEEVRYALVDEEADEVLAELDYNERNQVIFKKKTDKIEFKGPEIPEILDRYEYYSTVYTHREILIMVQNIVAKSHAISMSDGSGMWFMPVAMRDRTESLYNLVNHDLNGNYGSAFFRALGIANNEQDRSEMGHVLRSDIKLELADAQEKLDAIMSSDKLNKWSANSAMDRYRDAANKAKMYQSLLQINLEEINEMIQKNQEKLGKLLGIDADDDALLDEDSDDLILEESAA